MEPFKFSRKKIVDKRRLLRQNNLRKRRIDLVSPGEVLGGRHAKRRRVRCWKTFRGSSASTRASILEDI